MCVTANKRTKVFQHFHNGHKFFAVSITEWFINSSKD